VPNAIFTPLRQRDLERLAHLAAHPARLGERTLGHMQRVALGEDRLDHVQRRHVPCAVPLEHRGRLGVHVGAVLDRARAGVAHPDHALLAVAVRGDVATETVGLVHRGAHLVLRVAGVARIVVRRQYATRGEDLDHVGALLDVEAHLLAHLVHAVGDARGEVVAPVVVERVALVAVAAGHGQRPGRHLHARPGDTRRP
jgi:hypothetical protein